MKPESAELVPGPRPVLIIVSGLVASGKSTLSRALAARFGIARLEADRVRGTLLKASDGDALGPEARWRRDLSEGFEAEIYADLLRRADEILASGRGLVLDACFPRRSQREQAHALAARHGATCLCVVCSVPEATLRQRLDERDRAAGGAVWDAIHHRLEHHYEPLSGPELEGGIEVRTDGPTSPLVDEIAGRLGAAPPSPPPAGPRPRVVSFDCWQTLLAEEDWPWAHSLRVMALRDAAREAGREVPLEAAERAFESAWARHVALWREGKPSGAAEIAGWGLAELEVPKAHPAREHLMRRFEEASHTSHVVALEGSRALLAALDASGTPCVLVCDTGLTPGRVVRHLLDRVGLLEHLRALAFSDEVGVPKPDPRPFLAALAPLGVAPEHVLHVGDLRHTDVAGARALGMQTVRIRARHDDLADSADADWVVGSHRELAELLGLPPLVDPPPGVSSGR